ncbi:MAG: adenylate kinase [Clostridia bacterium]|nr:adenylate kinase [Clostridia bacterium]MBQ8792930.1 adenylate kinase [Clostridia bacterium]
MKIILLGAPGSGKGTLAKQISQDFDIPQISTGDLFRTAIREKTEIGLKVESIIARGGLVSDDITVSMLKDRIEKSDCEKGFILDGFPRSIAQAQALEKITDVDAVILVDLDFDIIINRLSTRRTCSGCGEIYNTSSYSKHTCLKCGANLIQRDDDKPESIKHRLEVYEKTTLPLINFYSGRLFKVSSAGTPEETYRPVKTFLKKLEG